MFDLFLTVAAFSGGYVASIYSWPWIRTQALGATAEAGRLRQRAVDIENKIRGTL